MLLLFQTNLEIIPGGKNEGLCCWGSGELLHVIPVVVFTCNRQAVASRFGIQAKADEDLNGNSDCGDRSRWKCIGRRAGARSKCGTTGDDYAAH